MTGPSRSFIEEARRQQIVDAAIETIAAVGYAKASFARIAAHARISPSLISYHFHSKDELIKTIAQTIDADLRGSVTAATEDARSHMEAARAVVVGFVHYVDHNRSQMLTLRQLETALVAADRANIGVLDEERGIADWQELLVAGQEAGEFRAFDARVMAASIMGMLGTIPRELFMTPDVEAKRLGDELATIVELAIRP